MQPNLWIIIFRIVLNADEGAKERIKNRFQKIFKSGRWFAFKKKIKSQNLSSQRV